MREQILDRDFTLGRYCVKPWGLASLSRGRGWRLVPLQNTDFQVFEFGISGYQCSETT